MTLSGTAERVRHRLPRPERYLRAAFSSSAADLRISRDSVSSFTALAIETAPTSAESAAMAWARRDFRVRPRTNLVSSSR